MESDKKFETIQEEIKLLKGELKNSLVSVRDYLLNMELPTTEFSTILAALGDSGEQRITMKGSFTAPPDNQQATEPMDEITQTEHEEILEDESELPSEEDDLISVDDSIEDESETLPDDNLIDNDQNFAAEESLISNKQDPGPQDERFSQPETSDDNSDLFGEVDEQDEALTPTSHLSSEEEQPMDYEQTTEANPGTPKVNMLTNLINWVAKAKKEIGYEQLSTFLEVYGVSGHLSPELKEVIIHLSELTSEHSEIINNAEVWSQSMLALHGILTGGDAPRHPIIPSWVDVSSEIEDGEEEIIEVDKPKETPVKLKLVFPDEEGKSKEFCIDLNPETASNGSPDTSGK